MIQSPNDSKRYRTITLDNGLRVLLIQNIESSKAAAALAVNAGHFNDPKHRQGLAHFLEHMLFLGTEKYPDGSEYQKFISKHGGNHNAWTGTEHTCFFFDIHHEQFEVALDRFSQFFISPLLSEEFLNKERQNIDAEFKLKLKDDIRRLYDVHKETINPEHPFSQFSVGNIDTLADRENISIRQEIVDFFERFYCAQYITLAIEGPQPIDELRNLAKQYFSPIKQAKQALPKVTAPLYFAEHQKIQLNVEPVKNDLQLIISFALPSIDHLYRHKPESLLAYLIGHEGQGSILSYLKHQQWAFRLTAGAGISASNFKDFNISISLTQAGEKNIDNIVSCVFSYIKLLQSAPIADFYYQEKKAIAMLSFEYQEKLKPLDSVSQYVINMQHYPENDYIFGDYVMDGICYKSLETLLDLFTPANMRLVHISQHIETNKISRWYQVPYQVSNLCGQQLKLWNNIELNPALYLPEVNEYIVASPTLVTKEEQQNKPTLIKENDGIRVWFKQDQSFNTPKGYIYIGIDCPATIENTNAIAMTRLFVELYSNNVVEENYNAELAGIHYHLYPHLGGMTLQLSGLSEKQPILLDKLLLSLKQQKFCPDTFELIKHQLIIHWKNTDESKSISQLFSTLSSTLQVKKPSNKELINVIADIDLAKFIEFSKQLFERVSLSVLIHGNWQKKDALNITNKIINQFNGKYSNKHKAQIPVLNLTNQGQQTIPLILPEHDHAAVVYYPMPDKSIKIIALNMVVSQLLSPHFFQQMRTEKQFGYLVGVGYVPMGYYPGLTLYIQSPHTKALDLINAIDEFTEQANTLINNLELQQWEYLQHGLASQLLEKDVSLRIKSQRFWGAICNDDLEFNRKELLIHIIKTLELSDIEKFIEQFIKPSKNQDRILLMSVKSKEESDLLPAKIINNIEKMQETIPIKF